MKKILLFALPLCLLLGCDQKPEQLARDGIVSASAIIAHAQQKNQDECAADALANQKSTIQKCVLINKAVDAQNLAITGLEGYCASAGFLAGSEACHPNKELEPKLILALQDLNAVISEVKGLK